MKSIKKNCPVLDWFHVIFWSFSEVPYDPMEDEDQSLTTSKTKVIVKLKKKACVCLRESQMNDYNNFVWMKSKAFSHKWWEEEEEREDVFKVENQIISMHLERVNIIKKCKRVLLLFPTPSYLVKENLLSPIKIYFWLVDK